jgi:hypothetical protein
MASPQDVENIINSVFSSYEARIQDIESIFITAHQILRDSQQSLFDTPHERESINTKLQESLARNESLRKKDFDSMMQEILYIQDQREREISNLLHRYFNEQKEMAQALHSNFWDFNLSLRKGEVRRVEEFQVIIKEILDKQETQKKHIISKLEEFQKERKTLESRLKQLLAKGSELQIRDFKLVVKEFKNKEEQRLASRRERKKEVRRLLGRFKKEREEAAKNWHTMQIKLAYKRAASKKGINTDAPGKGTSKK